MLLTKPLTTFLNANRTAQLQTLAIITPAGKVLASSSSSPAPVLRAQATLACSLWALYSPLAANSTFSSALPAPVDQPEAGAESDSSSSSTQHLHGPRTADPDINSILIQLEHGNMLLRALRCGLIFVAVAPPSSIAAASHPSTSSPRPTAARLDLSHLSISATSTPSSRGDSFINSEPRTESQLGGGVLSSAASDAGSSVTGGGGGGASMRVLKRQTEELARWLEDELDGFSLSTAL